MFCSRRVNGAQVHDPLVRCVCDPLIRKGNYAKQNQNNADDRRGFHYVNVNVWMENEAPAMPAQAPLDSLAMFAALIRPPERSGTK